MNRVGIDIGGTNTDIVVIDGGSVRLHKVPSDNVDPSRAVQTGLAELAVPLARTEAFAHGTTVATNTVLQRRGAKTGLITTRGFRDVLQIRRTTRGELYDFQWDPPAELVPRRWRREIDERVSADGEVLREPDLAEAVAHVRELVDDGVTSVAVAFINSYRNPVNEIAVKRRIEQELPGLPVYASADLLPAWREFERTSTAVVGAYVGPVLTDYLQSMKRTLRDDGYRYDLLVMQSNGGLGTADSAIENPVSTLMSGPAAGVIAQVGIGADAGITDLVGMDVGGTSTDISVVLAGQPQMCSEFDIEFGTVIGLPMIDITSIAAGGGTISWLDDGGLLHSGPQSAGAMPGPACYRRGGTAPTITDAHVVTGRLNPTALLGGSLPIDADLSRAAVAALGERCGLSLEAMAAGMIALTVSDIASAIRRMTVERGVNPREVTLVAYGGGGPTIGCDVADELEMPAVLVPRHPGLTSASGLLLTDIRHDYQHTFLRRNDDAGWTEVLAAFEQLVTNGADRLAHEGIDASRRRFELSADLRYVGQTHEITVALGDGYDADRHGRLSELLRADHLAQFGHAPDGPQPVEIVNLRVAAYGVLDRPDFGTIGQRPEPAPIAHRRLHCAGRWHDAPVFAREDLGVGLAVAGPTLVEQLDTTTVILEGWQAVVHPSGSLLVTRR